MGKTRPSWHPKEYGSANTFGIKASQVKPRASASPGCLQAAPVLSALRHHVGVEAIVGLKSLTCESGPEPAE